MFLYCRYVNKSNYNSIATKTSNTADNLLLKRYIDLTLIDGLGKSFIFYLRAYFDIIHFSLLDGANLIWLR